MRCVPRGRARVEHKSTRFYCQDFVGCVCEGECLLDTQERALHQQDRVSWWERYLRGGPSPMMRSRDAVRVEAVQECPAIRTLVPCPSEILSPTMRRSAESAKGPMESYVSAFQSNADLAKLCQLPLRARFTWNEAFIVQTKQGIEEREKLWH